MRITTLNAPEFQPTLVFLSSIFWIVDEPKALVWSECYRCQYSYERRVRRLYWDMGNYA
jgi:hypothetical protein